MTHKPLLVWYMKTVCKTVGILPSNTLSALGETINKSFLNVINIIKYENTITFFCSQTLLLISLIKLTLAN